MCPTTLKFLLVFVKLPNGISYSKIKSDGNKASCLKLSQAANP